MKLHTASLVASVLLAASCSFTNASPLQQPTKKAGSSIVGAAYFITNEPTGNFVIASNIDTSGKLSLAKAISAGGRGAHGISDSLGPDPFFSQGAIKASAAANLLATVNAGSDTVVLFSINPDDPTDIRMIGKPVSSEGQFPISVAFNKNSSRVCVLNGGEVNGVNCFAVDKKLGLISQHDTLRPLGLNQTTPANGPAGSASHIIFSEDGKKLIASVKGIPPTPGFLATWDVADDGSLSADFTASTPASGGLLPFSLTIVPGKSAVLATDAGVGFDIFDFAKGSDASSTVVPITGQMATCWSSFSPKTGNFYLTDIGTAVLTEVSVDAQLNGKIVKQYPQEAGSATIDNDIAVIDDKNFLYILAANATTINVLSLDAPGDAKPIQNLEFSKPVKASGLTISPLNVQGITTFIRK